MPKKKLIALSLLLLMHCSVNAVTPVPTDSIVVSDTDAVLNQGKELYASGQYMAALDKFMKVLRRDPKQPEAREYLRLVVDELRSKKGSTSPKTLPPAAQVAPVAVEPVADPFSAKPFPAPSTSIHHDLDKELKQRSTRRLLTADLSVMPGVKLVIDKNDAHVEIETPLLFADQMGGLKEEGIPLLDRVAAWLKTFGQEAIALHCYPEENADTALGGSLFLHRYAQLYGYFVEERKLSASRFIATGFLNKTTASPTAAQTQPRIVIVAVGGADDVESFNTATGSASRWLEFSIMAPRQSFNPDEGDWATLDLAAITPKQVANWRFSITPESSENKKSEALYVLEGKGNLLKRVSWDGRRQKDGSFVPAGKYSCKLVATNADGTDKTQLLTVQVDRKQAQAVVKATKPKSAPKAKPAAPVAATAEVPKASAEPAKAQASAKPSAPAVEEEDSSNAIWKQVIQFDAGESDLKPTVKASLERIGKTLEVYPLQKVRVTGFATPAEANSKQLAEQRAERIRQTLVTEYGVDPKRVEAAGGKVGSTSKVEISITN